ncbi:MAG: peptide ABC transporter substrate-binding protein [Pyrinomonadaceae bacterium]
MFAGISAMLIAALALGCGLSPNGQFFGKTVPPSNNVLRYITGPEPETLDPQLPDGQPEARIYMAMYEGLVEYDPKDQQPIPALAKSWETSPGQDEFLFHIRDNAKWSDGKPITAQDFVYSMRRGFRPDVISRTAQLGFFIKYAEAYKSGHVFVKKNGQFLLNKDIGEDEKESTKVGPETEFSKFMHSPTRLTIPSDEKEKAKVLKGDPKLAAAIEGAELVPVTAEDIGVEAIDDYTLRISLRQSAPFYLGLFAHQFFRLVPEQSVEKNGKNWTKPANIVTNGPFKVKEYRPYDILKLEKDPNYWDAANVHLDGIEFYPIEELSTIMNLYKAGSIDAMQNHAIPSSWISEIKNYKDEYLNFPEMAVAYYAMNMTKPPFDDIRVRRAFIAGLDREALSSFRKVTKPLYYMSPTGIFRDYDQALEKVSEAKRVEKGVSPEEWAKYGKFDADQARKLLTDAGFPVQKNGDTYSCPSFPTDKVTLTYNTNESNRSIAEFVQSQWKQHLGITIPLKNMEFKTFMPYFKGLEYNGFAQLLWSGDYVDPYSFLSLEYGKANEGGSGFFDPKFDKMLDDANSELDPQKRNAMVAEAEIYLMEQAPVVPLTVNATNWIKKPYVKGLYPNPGTLFPWKFVYFETDPAKWDKDVANIFTANDPKYTKQIEELKSTQKAAVK